ncbi:Ig-like domain-containing protein [Patescibacteria group bacterium]|nr:Ig-like domain-containing protein [Patescibacteria group bacterium]
MEIFKKKLIWLILALGAALIALFSHGLYTATPVQTLPSQQTPTINSEPQVIKTDPDPLNQATILPNQTISLEFNYPLQNKDELKIKIDPSTEFEVNLSSDRKTAQITFPNPLDLGRAYSLVIGPDTKFDGAKNLGHDIQYQFKTINYQGV